MKFKFSKFVRSYCTMDFRKSHDELELERIKRKARRFEVLKHTNNKYSEFV